MTEVQTPEVDERPTVIEALQNVMADVKKVAKDQTMSAPGQNFKFRGIDAILDVVGPALRDHQVIFVPERIAPNYAVVLVGQQQKPTREITLLVTYRIYGPRGDSITTTVPAESLDSGDKGTAKAMSVALRTVLIQTLAIPTGDPDPDSQVYERSSAQPRHDRSGPGGSVVDDVADERPNKDNLVRLCAATLSTIGLKRKDKYDESLIKMGEFLRDRCKVEGVWDPEVKLIFWEKVPVGVLKNVYDSQVDILKKMADDEKQAKAEQSPL